MDEQILHDQGHFELSPMYHQILLDRLLDCINVVQNNNRFVDQEELLSLMKVRAEKMILWLNQITFSNGNIPLLNDSASGIAPSTEQLVFYAIQLDVINTNILKPLVLNDSGYRMIRNEKYECVLDIGRVGSNYIPGHAHADTFNFVLNYNNLPYIVDTGISTYKNSKRRWIERSTLSHNTVTYNNFNSSDVWSSFRVGKRAVVKICKDSTNEIVAIHDGYKNYGIDHQRRWLFEKTILIEDLITPSDGNNIARIHFNHNLTLQKLVTGKYKAGDLIINFDHYNTIMINKYFQAIGFNNLISAQCLEIMFFERLLTSISFI